MAFTANFSDNFAFTVILILLVILHNPLNSAAVTVDLIPREASKSHFDRLQNALERSSNRVNQLKSVLSNNLGGSKTQTQIISDIRWAYLMNVSIGTPPVTVLGIADTGSDLVWTQCLPCDYCSKQDLPIFDPKKSLTYKNVSCQSRPCKELEQATCSNGGSTCGYSYAYNDGYLTSGDLSTETVTIGNKNSGTFKNIAFGCAHSTSETFDSASSGFIGLGGGPLSLVSQLDEKKFSYCLVPLSSNKSSKISFGSDAVVTGSGVVKTPLVSKLPKTFYYLTLESISVGNKKITYKGSSVITPDASGDANEGNIIIDIGTIITFLPTEFYSDVASEVEKAISAKKVRNELGLSPCYAYSDDLKIPDLTASFSGGDVKLSSVNTFLQVDKKTVCFAFADALTGATMPIYGNLAQGNFLVGYDLDAGTVSFLPKDCTKA